MLASRDTIHCKPQRVSFVYPDGIFYGKNKQPFMHVEYIKVRPPSFHIKRKIKKVLEYLYGGRLGEVIMAYTILAKAFYRVLKGKRYKPQPQFYEIAPEHRTSKDGDDLSRQEAQVLLFQLRCPDCGSKLFKGPEGCGAVNVYCQNESYCGSKYNMVAGILGERINHSRGYMVLVNEYPADAHHGAS